MQQIKYRKGAGIYNILRDHIKKIGRRVRAWLLKIFNDIIENHEITYLFRKGKNIATAYQRQEFTVPSSYRPVLLMSVCYKVLERIVYNQLLPLVLDNIPIQPACILPGRSCVEKVCVPYDVERGLTHQTVYPISTKGISINNQ